MPFRVSFFWSQQSDLLSGWSENFWNNLADLSGVIGAATNLRNALNPWHGAQTVCPYVRISDLTNFRGVEIVPFSDIAPGPVDQAEDSDYPTTAALLRLTSPGRYRTSQWLKGVQDRNIRTGGRWVPVAKSVGLWGVIAGLLTSNSNGWVCQHQDRSTPKTLITTITQAGVVTAPAHALATGDSVRISRAKGTFLVNGIWRILKIDGDNFSLVGFNTPATPAVYEGEGTAQKQVKIYLGITDARIIRASKHAVGRPFGQSGGRRRTRNRRPAGRRVGQ